MSIMLLVKHNFKTFWSLEFVLIVVYLSRAKVSSVLHLEKTILYLKKNQFFNLTVFENHQKCRIWYVHFWHFYNFWPIKIDLSGSTVWLQFSSLRIAKLNETFSVIFKQCALGTFVTWKKCRLFPPKVEIDDVAVFNKMSSNVRRNLLSFSKWP